MLGLCQLLAFNPRSVLPPGPDSPYRGNYASLPAVTLKPPVEGNRTVPVKILWLTDGVSPSYTIHFNARAQQVVSLTQIAALHVDNTQCGSSINIVFPDTEFQLQLGPNSEGFYPVITNSLEFYAYIDTVPSASDRSVIQVLNFMPPPIEFGSSPSGGSGVGTVREVDTVAPIQGGPITDLGTISLAVPLAINFGGTGGVNANAALDSLSSSSGTVQGALSRSAGGIWSVSVGAGTGTISAVNPGTGLTGGGASGAVTLGLSVPILLANGGTGSTTAAGALSNLGGAPLASPTLTGVPKAPTPATLDNSTQIATTAFVQAQGYAPAGPYLQLAGGTVNGGVAIAANAATVKPTNGRLLVTTNAGTTFPTDLTNSIARLIGPDSGVSVFSVESFGGGPPYLNTKNARGTAALPTALTNFDFLGIFQTFGHDGAGFASGGQTFFTTTQNWAAGAHGSQFNVQTCANGAATPVTNLTLDGSGNLAIIGGTAVKAGGGSWVAPSALDLKTNVRAYETGLQAILKLDPIRYEYNGTAGLPTGREFIGLAADHAGEHMPEMVGTIALAPEPDADPVDFQTLDMTALPLALVNAIKELAGRVAALEGK